MTSPSCEVLRPILEASCPGWDGRDPAARQNNGSSSFWSQDSFMLLITKDPKEHGLKVSIYQHLPYQKLKWNILNTYYLILKQHQWDFPGGPVAETLCSQCTGPGFNPCSHMLQLRVHMPQLYIYVCVCVYIYIQIDRQIEIQIYKIHVLQLKCRAAK